MPTELTQAAPDGRVLPDRPGRTGRRPALGRGRARRRPRAVRAECARAASPTNRPEPAPTSTVARTGSRLTLGDAEFDSWTGELRSLYGLPVDGPRLELWRAPTDNDRSDSRGSFELAGAGLHRRRGGAGAVVGAALAAARARPADPPRTRPPAGRRSAGGSGPGGGGQQQPVRRRELPLVARRRVWPCWSRSRRRPNWDCTWPRVGVRFDLPPELSRADWFGTGPLESYPDTRRAARVGRFSAEHRRSGRRLLPAAGDGASGGVAVPRGLRRVSGPVAGGYGGRPGRGTGPASPSPGTPRRSSTGRVTRTNCGPSEHVYLFMDDAVHGVGSRACGLDVQPQHALWPSARRFQLRFSAP